MIPRRAPAASAFPHACPCPRRAGQWRAGRGARGGAAVSEDQWQAGEEPGPMLEFLRGKAGDRKFRLFCCGCCRRVWGRLGWGRRRAIGIAERYADGRAGWWGSYLGEMLALPESDLERDEGRAIRTAAYVAVRLWGRGPETDGAAAAALVARLTRATVPPSGRSGGAHGASSQAVRRTLNSDMPSQRPVTVTVLPPASRSRPLESANSQVTRSVSSRLPFLPGAPRISSTAPRTRSQRPLYFPLAATSFAL